MQCKIGIMTTLMLAIVLVPTSLVNAAPGTDSTPPTSIRVAIRLNNNPIGPVDHVDSVTFYDFVGTSDYVQNVLGNEWICSWSAESLKTGAMAVKMYGWYHTIDPKYPAIGADVDNTVNSQVYIPGSAEPNCTSAIRKIAHIGYRRNWMVANPYIFETAYCAGKYRDDRSLPCTNYSVGDTVSQNGSHYWSDQGQSYQWILDNYYIPPSNTTQEYFSY